MRAADLFIRCLEAEGVERIFGIPGEENMDVMDALIDSTIKFTLTKHENSAAFIANACARLTGKAGVCLSTLGPGATNMATGVADAFLSNVPLIAITGQVGAERAYHPTKQYIDLVQMFKPITKDSFSIKTASRIPVQTRRAFSLACEEKPGPVHL
ncbi:MAG TPA: thiamine pyrophosphate-binding protein, partial [Methanomassiliicoccales archaeon]|nr:thiamine pyrophosphate-binding protein [Methanomassiliicoccales archaeon]